MDSGTVRGLAFNCHRLLSPAQECKDKMTAAITGLQVIGWIWAGRVQESLHRLDQKDGDLQAGD